MIRQTTNIQNLFDMYPEVLGKSLSPSIFRGNWAKRPYFRNIEVSGVYGIPFTWISELWNTHSDQPIKTVKQTPSIEQQHYINTRPSLIQSRVSKPWDTGIHVLKVS